MSDAITNLETSLASVPKTLELQVRSWLVAALKSWGEMPEELAARILEGVTASTLTAAGVRVLCDGATGDEDSSDRTRYSVQCVVMVLFDWKALSLDSFKAASSIVSRAIRSLGFDIAFQDTTGETGSEPFYWIPSVSGMETDVVSLDSEFWDGPTGRTYNHASYRFQLFFRKSPTVPSTHTLITEGE